MSKNTSEHLENIQKIKDIQWVIEQLSKSTSKTGKTFKSLWDVLKDVDPTKLAENKLKDLVNMLGSYGDVLLDDIKKGGKLNSIHNSMASMINMNLRGALQNLKSDFIDTSQKAELFKNVFSGLIGLAKAWIGIHFMKKSFGKVVDLQKEQLALEYSTRMFNNYTEIDKYRTKLFKSHPYLASEIWKDMKTLAVYGFNNLDMPVKKLREWMVEYSEVITEAYHIIPNISRESLNRTAVQFTHFKLPPKYFKGVMAGLRYIVEETQVTSMDINAALNNLDNSIIMSIKQTGKNVKDNIKQYITFETFKKALTKQNKDIAPLFNKIEEMFKYTTKDIAAQHLDKQVMPLWGMINKMRQSGMGMVDILKKIKNRDLVTLSKAFGIKVSSKSLAALRYQLEKYIQAYEKTKNHEKMMEKWHKKLKEFEDSWMGFAHFLKTQFMRIYIAVGKKLFIVFKKIEKPIEHTIKMLADLGEKHPWTTIGAGIIATYSGAIASFKSLKFMFGKLFPGLVQPRIKYTTEGDMFCPYGGACGGMFANLLGGKLGKYLGKGSLLVGTFLGVYELTKYIVEHTKWGKKFINWGGDALFRLLHSDNTKSLKAYEQTNIILNSLKSKKIIDSWMEKNKKFLPSELFAGPKNIFHRTVLKESILIGKHHNLTDNQIINMAAAAIRNHVNTLSGMEKFYNRIKSIKLPSSAEFAFGPSQKEIKEHEKAIFSEKTYVSKETKEIKSTKGQNIHINVEGIDNFASAGANFAVSVQNLNIILTKLMEKLGMNEDDTSIDMRLRLLSMGGYNKSSYNY